MGRTAGGSVELKGLDAGTGAEVPEERDHERRRGDRGKARGGQVARHREAKTKAAAATRQSLWALIRTKPPNARRLSSTQHPKSPFLFWAFQSLWHQAKASFFLVTISPTNNDTTNDHQSDNDRPFHDGRTSHESSYFPAIHLVAQSDVDSASTRGYARK